MPTLSFQPANLLFEQLSNLCNTSRICINTIFEGWKITKEEEMEESFGLSKKDTKTKTEIQPFWFLKPKPGFSCTVVLREY
jgi:hypothetical protein